MPKLLGWFLTFNFVNIAWAFFRAGSWSAAIKVLRGMFGFSGVVLPTQLADVFSFLEKYGIQFGGTLENLGFDTIRCVFLMVFILAAFLLSVFSPNSIQIAERFKPKLSYAIAFALLAAMAVIRMNNVSDFIYFKF